MANKKISELQSRTPALSDLMLVGDPSSGYSYKCTVTALATIIETDIADGFVTIGTTQTVSGAKTFSNNLTLTSVANTPTDPDKFLTLNASNVVTYRTGAEVLSDIGGASSSSISGTTNYIPKFTSSTAIGNSIMYESIAGIGVGLTSPSATFHVNGTGRFEGSLYASEVYLSSPNNIVGIIDSTNANGGFLQFSTSSTVIAEMGASQSVIGSGGNNLFALNAKGSRDLILATNATERVRIASTGSVTLSTIANATIDTDKFLVSDSGVIKYRTGAEVLSDIGGASSSSISGTTNYIPKFTSSSAIGNSNAYDNNGAFLVGITTTYGDEIARFYNSSNAGRYVYVENPNTGISAASFVNVLAGAGADLRLGAYGTNHSTQANNATIFNHKATGSLLFGTVGSERMRLDASGNLGLGTSNPIEKFTSNGLIAVTGASATAYYVGNNNAAFLDYNSGDTRIGSQSSAGSSRITFYTTSSGYTGITERMRLDASGNLGLGVSPSAWGSGYTALQIENTGFMADADRIWMYANGYFNGTSNLYIQNGFASRYYQASGQHIWENAPSGTAGNAISFTQAMTLDASGRLGIGTTSPSAKLHIGESGAAAQLWLQRTDGYNPVKLIGGTLADGSGFKITMNTTDAFAITSGGNVGIGTTSPTQKLTIGATNGYPIIDFNNSGTIYGDIGYNAGSTSFNLSSYSTTPLAFYTNNTERMRITSGGLVGIGTSSPANLLTLKAGVVAPVLDIIRNGGGQGKNSGILFRDQSSNEVAAIGTEGQSTNDLQILSNSGIRFYTSSDLITSNERMRITSGGELLVNTTSDAGDYKLQVNGNSYFNGNVIANTGVYGLFANSASRGGFYSYNNVIGSGTDYSPTVWSETGLYFTTNGATKALTLTSTQNAEFAGSIKTAAPSGGTAKPWKLGEAGVTLGGSNTSGVRVEIDGTVYYLVTGYLP